MPELDPHRIRDPGRRGKLLSASGALLLAQLAIEREWGKDPGWLGTQPPDVVALLLADYRVRRDRATPKQG